jgi:hypothetical protein
MPSEPTFSAFTLRAIGSRTVIEPAVPTVEERAVPFPTGCQLAVNSTLVSLHSRRPKLRAVGPEADPEPVFLHNSEADGSPGDSLAASTDLFVFRFLHTPSLT